LSDDQALKNIFSFGNEIAKKGFSCDDGTLFLAEKPKTMFPPNSISFILK